MEREIAVTVVNTVQISMDEYRDFRTTKVFRKSATIKEIEDWAKTISPKADILSVQLSDIV
jgi:hypothetical protein